MRRIGAVVAAWALAAAAVCSTAPAAAKKAAVKPPKEKLDKAVGEYVGSFTSSAGEKIDGVAQVSVSRGSQYRVALTAVKSGLIEKAVIGPDAKVAVAVELRGSAEGDTVKLTGRGWTGSVSGGKLTATGKEGAFELSGFVRKSPTELAKPPAGAIVLLPYAEGKAPSLAEWTNQQWVALGDGSMMIRGGDSRTKRELSKFKLHLEFRIPTDGRSGGNSGVYILGRYEIQILDSFGKKPYKGGCAAVYQTFPPTANASLPAGRWQTYDITFHGPKLDGDKVVRLPKVTVVHNGITVHKDVDVPHATGHARPRGHAESGPILLQDHGSATRFRNIWIVELEK